ncbi:hypothetical protein [Pontibacter anaerobius]|uniref:Uncharacterized protein n=1 Tax=Pontibacter anaerobius TaxID=2993940 RepID=A0ABT3RAB8_9BACT|nr:hypothetical protein [Pontibacter anaerobius]MCX2738447.1 hypothetical protein [Pontibacter anaerobius]
MKKTLVILFILYSYLSYGQTYSSIISDSDIEQFVQWEILTTPKYSEDRKWGKKKLYYKPESWKKAMVHISGPMGDTLSFEIKFYRFLSKDTVFTKEDVAFLSQQYEAEKQNVWETKFEGANLVKSSGRNVHEFTIPLFSIDKSKVMFWKYFYCGSLCAHACVFIYEKVDENNWKLVSKYGCWIS